MAGELRKFIVLYLVRNFYMSDEGSDGGDFDWDLQSSKVRAGNKIPIPEGLRKHVVIDSGSEDATWWGYDKETGYAFLSDQYTHADRYIIVNNRSYKLEKSSRVSLPKSNDGNIDEGVLAKRPDEGNSVYFYTDDVVLKSRPFSVLLLSEEQLMELINPPNEEVEQLPEFSRNIAELNRNIGYLESVNDEASLSSIENEIEDLTTETEQS